MHDSVHLNRVTPQNERIYLIVKTTVQLSHPAAMELVLRKRIAANIYNKQVVTGPDSALVHVSSKCLPSLYHKVEFCGVDRVDMQHISQVTVLSSCSQVMGHEDSIGKCHPPKGFSSLADLRPIILGGSRL